MELAHSVQCPEAKWKGTMNDRVWVKLSGSFPDFDIRTILILMQYEEYERSTKIPGAFAETASSHSRWLPELKSSIALVIGWFLVCARLPS